MSEEQKTLTPTFIVYLNGTRFSVDQESSVKQIIVSDRINVPSSCNIVLADHDKIWMDDVAFEEGSTVSVHLGFKDYVEEVFNGEVVGLDVQMRKGAQTTTIVSCMNSLHRLRRAKKHRIFSETSDSDILTEIAQENGLSLEVDEIGGEKLFMVQKDVTDHEFMLSIAERYGCKLWASDRTIFFKQANEEDNEEVVLEWGKTLNEFSARTDSSAIVTEVNITGWDNDKGESFLASAAYGDVDPVGGTSFGGGAVEANFGPAIMTSTDAGVKDQSEAEALALETVTDNSFFYVTGNGSCEGNNAVKAGNLITIKEVGGRFSGEYLVVEARHAFHATSGYTTYFSVVRNSV
ncbi:phage late control D family protein [Sediminispirochaeta bajacaliforniensis]|uniref:phage late control D family protein n=1 Tax=Sediminispirochaeta bajacaliforniensis TaxID=148 RepID=UPI000364B764|nr:contractile injection system protein, VgrG/Pvc8 family [Sediminispirochaeta bajacaliforniensis]